MSKEDIRRWEERYQTRAHREYRPDPWIVERARRLPAGLALDLASGIGQHANWLGQRGHAVIAIDASYTALSRGHAEAVAAGVADSVLFVQADLERFTLPDATFDLIVVSRFLLRSLVPSIVTALRPAGHLLYATFTLKRLEQHPQFNPNYLLAPNELPRLFDALNIIEYNETYDWAQLHARRPA